MQNFVSALSINKPFVMKTLKFKSSINCSGCLLKIGPVLNKTKGINKWEVDINHPNKILFIETDSLMPSDIIDVMNRIGYSAEEIK
jgi:copper chaperone